MMIKIVELSHKILSEFKDPKIALDMTAGRGYDSLFLSKIAKNVYSFDIQEEAIASTLKLLNDNNVHNVKLIRETHDLFDIFVHEKIDICIYNLGYLPSGLKDIKTNANIVINSLDKLLKRLSVNGIVVIVVYLHDNDESIKLHNYVKNLADDFDVMKYEIMNKESSPYILRIQKIKE